MTMKHIKEMDLEAALASPLESMERKSRRRG